LIISASYKTDLPMFYGEWFMNRLKAGYCRMLNPYNSQSYRVSLLPEDVDGFVFWTKSLGPFMKRLEAIREMGFFFIIQYTITNYPRALEPRVVISDQSAKHMHKVVQKFGRRTAVWRYDPIIFSSATPPEYHQENFEALASLLEGATDEVVVSFMQVYQKTRTKMDRAGRSEGFSWEDPTKEKKLALLESLVGIAKAHGMQLTMCAQPDYQAHGAGIARCVDARRLSDVSGREVKAAFGGGRVTCGCYQSKDIGDYNTCLHGCRYCYAVQGDEVSLARYKGHDPQGEFLIAPGPPR